MLFLIQNIHAQNNYVNLEVSGANVVTDYLKQIAVLQHNPCTFSPNSKCMPASKGDIIAPPSFPLTNKSWQA